MKYIKIEWIHNVADEPVLLYSELDENNFEIRKVEIYSSGKRGYASKDKSVEGTELGLEKLPGFEEIKSDPQFKLTEVDKSDFESIWDEVVSGN